MVRHLVWLAALLLAPLKVAYASAWLEPQGQGQIVTQASYFTSDQYYNHGGDLVSQSRYTKYEVSPYLEYGWRPNLTVGATASLQHDVQSGSGNEGIADPSVFFRFGIWKDDRQVVSLQPLIKFSSAFDQSGAPRGGSKSTDLELSLGYGRNLHLVSDRDYLDLRAGYRYRSGVLSDQAQADALLGLQVAQRWQIIPAIRSVFATTLKTAPFSENGDLDYNLVKAELSAAYAINDKETAALTLFDHVDGRQTGNGGGVTLSFAYKF